MGGQLILIRHGIAEERTPEGDDFYRKLTEAGVEELTAFLPDIAPLLTEGGNLKIWTSPLVRARQTAELVAEATAVEVIQPQEFLATGDYRSLHGCIETGGRGFQFGACRSRTLYEQLDERIDRCRDPVQKRGGRLLYGRLDRRIRSAIWSGCWRRANRRNANTKTPPTKCMRRISTKGRRIAAHAMAKTRCTPVSSTNRWQAFSTPMPLIKQDPVEPESAHALRVAIRQLRALLNFNKANGEEKYYREAGEDWREIATTFGYLRELDVLMEECRELRGLYPDMLAEDGQVMTWLMEERQGEQDSIHELITSGALTERILDAEAATAQFLKSIQLG